MGACQQIFMLNFFILNSSKQKKTRRSFWCGWWDVQSSENLTPQMGKGRRAPAPTKGGSKRRSV